MIEWNFVDKWFITKDNSENKNLVVNATVSVPDHFQGFIKCTLFAIVDEIN